MTPLLALVRRELRLALIDGGALGTAFGFFLVVITLMPLGLGPDVKLLSRIAPGIIWIAVLLSALLSSARLFERDLDDGSLELLAAGAVPLELVALVKATVHWLTTSLPLALLAPVAGLMLNLDIGAMAVLVATLAIGGVAISALGTIGAALTLGANRGGVLIALVVLPLYVPTLIYGILAISAVTTPPGDLTGALMILAAISLIALVIGPLATAAALRAVIAAR
ncbi:MAG: heme exporter protein CcmB [Pseudomonadota bacterium]